MSDSAASVERRVEALLGRELSGALTADERLGWAGTLEVSRVLSPRHDREMAARHGLSLTLLTLLGRLQAGGDSPPRARELAADMDLSPGKVSRHLTTLEAAGLVRRTTSADDRRALDVELTDAGRERLAAARETALEIVRRDFLAPLTEDELATLARITTKLVDAVGVRERGDRPAPDRG